MDLLPLTVLPPGSLDSSVITTTLIGVFVLAFFNLRFGWVLSGIVVPGYLVPLLLIKPASVLVIGAEAVVTYTIVWLLSDQVSRSGLWSSVFGRDRFFLIVVVSIIVRVTFDGFVMPAVGRSLVEAGFSFDYENVLHSFGLIVIALLANQFWKTGLVRGMRHAVVVTAVTYLIVRYGLIELTNFRMAEIGYLYEDLASSVLATPKAYIILVTTAFIASRLNLHYGWDFNGILIPSLIALQWFQPMKVAASIAEAFVILGVAVLLLRTPLFANRTIEGARKLLLFFSISFAYRYVLGWTLPQVAPDLKVTDYFGFGYLLSTLIAIKIHDKGIPTRLTRATLQVSVMGLAFGTGIGFTMAEAGTFDLLRTARPRPAATVQQQAPQSLDTLLADFKIRVYETSIGNAGVMPDVLLREGFVRAARKAVAGEVAEARAEVEAVGGRLRATTSDVVVLDMPEFPAWGFFAVRPAASSDVVVELPDPLQSRLLLDASAVVFEGLKARSLIVGGLSALGATTGEAATPSFSSLYHAMHQALAAGPVLMMEAADGPDGPRLRLEAPVPAALDTAFLDSVAGPLSYGWGRTTGRNLQAATAPYLAVLSLDREAIRTAMFRAGRVTRGIVQAVEIADTSDHLRSRLLAGPEKPIADDGPDWRAPTQQELLFLDSEVVSPLIEAAPTGDPDLAALAGAAAAGLGYRVVRLDDAGSGSWLVLEPDPAAAHPHPWGTYVFRIGEATPYAIQVPRPAVERDTLDTALDLLARTEARALAVTAVNGPGSEPETDVTRSENALSLFTLVSQALLRQAQEPFTVVQVRGFAATPDVEADVIADLAGADPSARPTFDDPALVPLADALDAMGLSVAMAGGGEEEAMVAGGVVPQAAYLRATRTGRFALLWLSPQARAGFAAADRDERTAAASLGLSVEQANLAQLVAGRGTTSAGEAERTFAEAVASWRTTGDMVLLHEGVTALQAAGLSARLVIDAATLRGTFAVLRDDRVSALVKAAAPQDAATTSLAPEADAVDAFLLSPAGAALAGGG